MIEIIYSNEEIKCVYDLMKQAAICREPPDKMCTCKKCFKYEVQINKVEEIYLPEEEL